MLKKQTFFNISLLSLITLTAAPLGAIILHHVYIDIKRPSVCSPHPPQLPFILQLWAQ